MKWAQSHPAPSSDVRTKLGKMIRVRSLRHRRGSARALQPPRELCSLWATVWFTLPHKGLMLPKPRKSLGCLVISGLSTPWYLGSWTRTRLKPARHERHKLKKVLTLSVTQAQGLFGYVHAVPTRVGDGLRLMNFIRGSDLQTRDPW